MTPERDTAEFAVIVADPWQGKGLGKKLIERVVGIAKENGVRSLYGDVLFENQRMIALAKKIGFNLLGPEEGIMRVELDPTSWTGAD
jgi:acetyltransferase